MDLVVQAKRAPEAGETLSAGGFQTIPGGKGANQAVAASRLGGQVQMLGCVGADGFGAQLSANLERENVDTTLIRRLPDVSSGVALIIVEESGENRILIVPGANGQVAGDDVAAAARAIGQAGLLVTQFEIPLPTVQFAIQLARQQGVPVLLNPAPAYPVPNHFLQQVDYLVLNETEGETMSGLAITSAADARQAGERLLKAGAGCAIITLGAGGAVAVAPGKAFHVPAFPVKAVDTTAAGDAFIGALAVSIIQNTRLEESIRFASAAGALAVTRLGAQTSLPTLDEVRNYLHATPGLPVNYL